MLEFLDPFNLFFFPLKSVLSFFIQYKPFVRHRLHCSLLQMSLPFSGSVDHNAGASDGNAVLAVPVDPSPGANATKKSSRSRKERGSGAPKRPRTSNKGSETGNSTLSAQRKKGKMEAASVNSPEVSMSPGENKKIKFEAVGDAGNSRRKNEENIAQENQDSVEIEPFSGISKSTKEKIRLLCACAHPSSFEVNLESKKEEFGGTEEKKKLDLVFLGLRKESVALRQDAKHFDGYLFKCVLDEFFSKETAADRLILLGKLLLRLGKIEMISFDFVLSEITSRMEISQLETWNVSCYILLKLFPLCKYTLRERIWNHLIAETSKLPYSLSPSQQEAAEYSLLVLDSILHAANGGIPQDFVMTEKQKYHRIIRSNSNTDSADIIHWILQPFLIPIFKRLNNLEHIISLGTSNAALGSYVFGSVDRLSKYTNSVISQLGYGFEKVSATYYNLLVEHAPLSVFTLDLSPTHVGQVTSSSSSSKDSFQNLRNVSSKRSRETSPTVESKSLATNSQTEPRSAVRRAVLLRIMMLINYLLGRDSTDHDLDVERTLSNSVFEGWKYSWGEWLIFADQVCALIAAKLLDYTELITSIDKMFRSHDLNARFEHYVIWMISQIMPLEIVKQIFQMDLQFNKSSLSLKIMEFYDSSKEPKSDSYGLSEIRDASIVSFILRLKNINPSFQISENIDLIYKKYANWWTEVTDASSNHSIDIYQPTESDLVNVSILSSCSSESVSMYFLSIINKNPESEWADNCSYLPGQILFEGRTKALPTALLFNLSIRCRVRLLMNMEPFIYPSLHDGIDSAKTFSQAKIVSPGFLETYIRLLYTCPYLKGESFYRIINTLKQSNDLNVVHTLVEAINYRLFRILLHRGELINLFVALEDTLSRVRHSQLTDSIQTLLFKISTTYHGIISLIRYKAKAQLNELVSRAVFVGIARSLKIRELSSHHVSDQQLVSFVESYFSSSGRKWSENSIKFFPSSLKKAINYVLKLKQDSFRQKHDFRWELAESEGLNPHISKLKEFTATCSDQVISYLSADSLKRTLFYSAIAFNWIVSLGSSFFEFHYQGVCAKLPQVDCVAGVYALVDVLLDALDRQLLDPYLKLNVVSTVKREPLSLVCELLCVFIEQYKFISLGNVIMSLADRDDNKFSFRIIDSLLFDSRINLIGRIEFLSGKMFSCEPWDDTDFFERHSSYHSNFMEIAPTSAEETILPVYFGNVCTKIVPVLDMLIGRLIENEERELLLKVVSSFAVLFRAYHDSPVNFVKNLLVYYSESPILDFSVKSKLFSLCGKYFL